MGPGSQAQKNHTVESTRPLFHSLEKTPTCENMVLLVAVDTSLRASSGCRSVTDAAVGTGKQAAPSNSVDTLTPKCIEGLADMLAPDGLRVAEKQEAVRMNMGPGQKTQAPSWDPWGPQHHAYPHHSRDKSYAQAEADSSVSRQLHHK